MQQISDLNLPLPLQPVAEGGVKHQGSCHRRAYTLYCMLY